jgi:hypothetical protein
MKTLAKIFLFASALLAIPANAGDQDEPASDPPAKTEFSKRQWLPLKQCEKVSTGYFTRVKYADTTHCFLQIDGKIIINRMCHIYISQQLRTWNMDVGEIWIAEVWMKYRYENNVSEKLRNSLYASFEKRGRPLDWGRIANYGRVEGADDRQNRKERTCWSNKRFRMCFSEPYLICERNPQ